MNRSSSPPAGLPIVVALLLVTGCTTPPPSPPRTAATPVPAVSPSGPAPAPPVKYVPSDIQLARKLLEKAGEAMGGAPVIDGVKTLVLGGMAAAAARQM